MQPDKVPQLVAALQNKTCNLPCYLGISPGETTLQKGIAILENLGGVYFKEDGLTYPFQRQADGAFLYTYSFKLLRLARAQ